MSSPTVSQQLGATLELKACANCSRPNPPDSTFCAGCGTALPRPQSIRPGAGAGGDPLVGTVIADRYRLLGVIGRGGMGVVYKAEHARIGKLVAVKLLAGELARDRNTMRRFQREAEAVSRLNHANTVQVFDFGSSEGLSYLVMEYVEGHDLGTVLRTEGPMPFGRAAWICAQVCASLQEAHEHGIVHRDLKPENLMVGATRTRRDSVKVLDFGLAKLRDDGGRITGGGALVGTPYYMAPEYIRGDNVDGRADLYALGAVLYRACTGTPPFSASTPLAVLTKHVAEELEPPSFRIASIASRRSSPADATSLPPAGEAPTPRANLDMDRVIGRAMAKDPAVRYADANELRRDLVECLTRSGEQWRTVDVDIQTDSSDRVGASVATRSDVDRYERGLHQRGLAVRIFLVLFVVAGAAAGAWSYQHRASEAATVETEPNNDAHAANPLPPGNTIRGLLGARYSQRDSDRDVYAIKNPKGASRSWLRVSLTAIPNMDVAFDIARKGNAAPVIVANSRGRGQAEAIPNFVLDGAEYYIRVREASRGDYAIENVSDSYTIRWEPVVPRAGEEREVNDSVDVANPLDDAAPVVSVRGYIGWNGDVDAFCTSPKPPTGATPGVRARLEPHPLLDLEMQIVRDADTPIVTVDDAPAKFAETTPTIARSSRVCFLVRSASSEDKRALNLPTSDPDRMYTLIVEGGALPAPPHAPPATPAPRPRRPAVPARSRPPSKTQPL